MNKESPSARVIAGNISLRLGTYGTLFAMAAFIFLLAYETQHFLKAAISGDIIVKYFAPNAMGHNVSAIKTRLFIATILSVITAVYILLVRRYSDQKRRPTRYIFCFTAAILCLLQFPPYISAFTLLLQYIHSYGYTVMRIMGLIYSLGAFAFIIGFFFWLARPAEKSKAQQSVPGYPPQGVGSPEP
jgi:hypothetical protein